NAGAHDGLAGGFLRSARRSPGDDRTVWRHFLYGSQAQERDRDSAGSRRKPRRYRVTDPSGNCCAALGWIGNWNGCFASGHAERRRPALQPGATRCLDPTCVRLPIGCGRWSREFPACLARLASRPNGCSAPRLSLGDLAPLPIPGRHSSQYPFLIFLTLAPHFCPFPMDTPREEVYFLWHVQRTEHRGAEIGSPSGDARPDGIESSRGSWAAARLWYRPPDRASERTGSAIK